MEGSEQQYTQAEMKYMSAVRKDSTDFTSWTNLLQLVEQKVIHMILTTLCFHGDHVRINWLQLAKCLIHF